MLLMCNDETNNYYWKMFSSKSQGEPEQVYFYILTDRENNDSSVPDYVFPTFTQLFDIMETVKGDEWRPGRIRVKGDFFVSRKQYLKLFLNRQTESIQKFEELFGGESSSNRPSSFIPENNLQEFEDRMFYRL